LLYHNTLQANIYKLAFAGIIYLLFLTACKPTNAPVYKAASVDSLIRVNIAEGNRLAEVNNDSLKITSQTLYDLYRSSASDSALVYADFFESIYYWHNAGHQKAMQLAISALGNAQKADLKDVLPRIYTLITNIESKITDYSLAITTVKRGLNAAIQQKDTATIIALLGLEGMLTLREGVLKKDDRQFYESLEINNRALKIAQSNIKYEWQQTRLLNIIAQCYFDRKEFKQAANFFKQAIVLGKKYMQALPLIRSYCRLGETLYYLNNKNVGIAYLHEAIKMSRQERASFWLIESTAAVYRCYLFSKDFKLAIRYEIENRNIRDSLKALDDVRHIGEMQLRYEAAKKDKEIDLLNAKNKLDMLLLYASALVAMLLIVIAVLFYLKQKKERKLLLAEKALVDDELRRAEIDLNNFTENLKSKNSLIEEFKSRIEHLHLQNVNRDDIENMEQMLKAHIMTEESWERFKRLFDKVYPVFSINLKNKVPCDSNLTATDTRILVLIKLQLSNLEMANLAGITIEGIKKSKQRLRKKLSLDAAESLSNFVENI
jgi:tetratricopeptide (TPR) repeat protein